MHGNASPQRFLHSGKCFITSSHPNQATVPLLSQLLLLQLKSLNRFMRSKSWSPQGWPQPRRFWSKLKVNRGKILLFSSSLRNDGDWKFLSTAFYTFHSLLSEVSHVKTSASREHISSINSLSPNSDQQQFSPNNIHMLAREIVMRVNTMITKEKMLWSVIKLSQLIL